MRLEEAFRKFDKAGNGSLDKVEFAVAMRFFGFGHVADQVFEFFDKDDSGELLYTEFEESVPVRRRPLSSQRPLSCNTPAPTVVPPPTERVALSSTRIHASPPRRSTSAARR